MKSKWGALMVDGRGKIGGHVASKNRAGSYLRTKVSPAQPASTYSANVRARLTAVSQAWRALGDAGIKLWNKAVSDFKRSDVFGDIHNPSGFNLFQQLNNNLTNIGATNLTVPPVPTAVPTLASFSATVVNATGVVTLTFAPAIAATEKVLLFATTSLSVGKNFAKSEFRQIAVLTSADTSPYVGTVPYAAKFGAPGAVGKKVFFMMRQIKIATGQAGLGTQCQAVIS